MLDLVDDTVHLALNAEAYRSISVQKSSYRFADRCTVIIGAVRAGVLPLALAFPMGTARAAALEVARLFLQDLLDQELREKAQDETRAMRALLLAHAFSRTNLIRRD